MIVKREYEKERKDNKLINKELLGLIIVEVPRTLEEMVLGVGFMA